MPSYLSAHKGLMGFTTYCPFACFLGSFWPHPHNMAITVTIPMLEVGQGLPSLTTLRSGCWRAEITDSSRFPSNISPLLSITSFLFVFGEIQFNNEEVEERNWEGAFCAGSRWNLYPSLYATWSRADLLVTSVCNEHDEMHSNLRQKWFMHIQTSFKKN